MKHPLIFLTISVLSGLAANAIARADVRADSSSIAIGGSVTQSTFIIGIPQEKVDELVRDAKRPLEELTAQQRDNIVLLKDKLDLNVRQVRAALAILGENDIPPERLAARLVEIAQRFNDLQATASALPGDSQKVIALKAEAQKAIGVGELAKADSLLAEIDTEIDTEESKALDRFALKAAENSARRGDIALARLRYSDAAGHFANAAAKFPRQSTHEDMRLRYLFREADAFYRQGDEFGDNAALRSAINRYQRLIDLTPRERVPLDWAMARNNLGTALGTLGERESGTARLEEAVTAYRDALQEQTRERELEWATTQNNLGLTLLRLGEREGGTARAFTAFRDALKEWTRERVPLQWAMARTNLGAALLRLAQREGGTARLEEAVTGFRDALQEQTRERGPLQWATTQNSLGLALWTKH